MKRRGFLASIFAIPSAIAAAKEIKPAKVMEAEKKLKEIHEMTTVTDPMSGLPCATACSISFAYSISGWHAIADSGPKLVYPIKK